MLNWGLLMRTANKIQNTNVGFIPHYFDVKKNDKQGVILTSPKINWPDLSQEETRIQWQHCLNILWFKEKEGHITKDHLYAVFYSLLNKIGFKPEEIAHIRKLKDWEISSSLLSSGFIISIGGRYKPEIVFFIKRIRELIQKSKNKIEPVKLAIIKSDPLKTIVSDLICDLQGYEDDKFNCKINFEEWVKEKKASKEVYTRVANFFIPVLVELVDVKKGKDEQLNEGYKSYTPKQIVQMINFYIKMIKALQNAEGIKRIVTRKSKPVTPDKIVKKLKYCSIDSELGIKSINPEKIINATILWLFNIKTRKMILYNAEKDKTLSIKGSSLLNYDVKASFSKTLRKPKEQLETFMSGGKVRMLEIFNSINSKNSTVSGRINTDTILLRVF